MPTVVLKNFIMGNLRRPTRDTAIADSIDFISDTVIVVIVFLYYYYIQGGPKKRGHSVI